MHHAKHHVIYRTTVIRCMYVFVHTAVGIVGKLKPLMSLLASHPILHRHEVDLWPYIFWLFCVGKIFYIFLNLLRIAESANIYGICIIWYGRV